MEPTVAAVAGVAAAVVVIISAVFFLLIRGTIAEQREREEKYEERLTSQAKLYQWERDWLRKAFDSQTELHQKEGAKFQQRLVEQERLHQTERRELYERIQGAPVNTVPLLTGEDESGTDKGVAGTKDPDEMSPEELAKIGVVSNSDGGFIDLRSKDKQLCDTVKDLLFYRKEAEKEKKEIAASV